MNKDQLEKAIKGIYGTELNATSYLQKFIDLTLTLPRVITPEIKNQNHIYLYVMHLVNLLDFEDTGHDESALILAATLWGNLFNFSLRDLERLFLLLAASGTIHAHTDLKVYLAALKIRAPSVFNDLHRNPSNPSANKAAIKVIQDARNEFFGAQIDGSYNQILEGLVVWHNIHSRQFSTLDDKVLELIFNKGVDRTLLIRRMLDVLQHAEV
jgi:hypothetical protein